MQIQCINASNENMSIGDLIPYYLDWLRWPNYVYICLIYHFARSWWTLMHQAPVTLLKERTFTGKFFVAFVHAAPCSPLTLSLFTLMHAMRGMLLFLLITWVWYYHLLMSYWWVVLNVRLRLVTDIPETTDTTFGKWLDSHWLHCLNVACDLCSS